MKTKYFDFLSNLILHKCFIGLKNGKDIWFFYEWNKQ
jgi:hypothetical protein